MNDWSSLPRWDTSLACLVTRAATPSALRPESSPGARHHVICRGIERRPIVRDDTDRAAFVERVGQVVATTGTPCYAWALLPNHVHLLLRTGAVPLTTVMR